MDILDQTICEQLLYFDTNRYIKRSFASPCAAAQEFSINFHLSCKSDTSRWVVHEDSSEPQLVGRSRGHTRRKLIRLNLEEFGSDKKARKIIGKKIKKWPIWGGGRKLLIDFVLKKAWEDMESIPPSHNVVHFYFHVIPSHKHVFEAGDGMIPAMESSIESLKNTTLFESGNCAICLEDFVNGGEDISMPCSHIFHGDCIRKWLRTSHYCPICRFQMPTSDLGTLLCSCSSARCTM